MPKKLFILSGLNECGSQAVALGLIRSGLARVNRLYLFRPICSTETDGKDGFLSLSLSLAGTGQEYSQAVCMTSAEAAGFISAGQDSVIHEAVFNKLEEIKKDASLVLCYGADLPEVSANANFDYNLSLCKDIGADPVVVVNGLDKTPDKVREELKLVKENCLARGLSPVLGFVVGVPQASISEYLEKTNDFDFKTYILPYDRAVYNVSLAQAQRALDAQVLCGDNIADFFYDKKVVAAMHLQDFLHYLTPGCLVVTPGDRSDIILACLAARQSGVVPSPAGLMLSGGQVPSTQVQAMANTMTDPVMPILVSMDDTYNTVKRLEKVVSKILPGQDRKLHAALGIFEENAGVDILHSYMQDRKPESISPKMFEFRLVKSARDLARRVVLPEGESERILRAADIALRRSIASVIILGDEQVIRAKACGLGLDLSSATIINPVKSPDFEDYVDTFHELRKRKGLNKDAARDMMLDKSYFGTMMVYKDHADAMVSGSTTTTANTIRPAFQIIKTKPGISVASSIFLMCLPERVLVYGDCAVNPDPNPEELAQIAVSSAESAVKFGIDPKVAMLSYSTGASGMGQDVEKVRKATEIVKQMRPDLPVEGPVQYDAAVDPTVAEEKLPGSKVAGHATVLIFPDLDTGNNTYKAVQRSSGAVAIGPVLQGLKKPVLDLSRGCKVKDIVYTIACAAIQSGGV